MVATEGIDVEDRVKVVLEVEEQAAQAAENRLGESLMVMKYSAVQYLFVCLPFTFMSAVTGIFQ